MNPGHILAAVTILLGFVAVEAEEDLIAALESRVQECAARVTPSLVAIEARLAAPMAPSAPEPRSILRSPALPKFASGLLVSDRGHIIALADCVTGRSRIEVTLSDGRRRQAKLEARDGYSNLALLRLEEPALPAVKWADSVSGTGRRVGGYVGTLLQTTAPINPGDAGGVLANLDGEVVGVICSSLAGATPWTLAEPALRRPSAFNNYRFPYLPGANQLLPGQPLPQAISFAIPSNTARRVAGELIEKGRVDWGYLGLMISAPSEKSAPKGIKVDGIAPGSPAEDAGVRPADLVTGFTSSRGVRTSFGGKLDDCSELQELVLNERVGRDVTLVILRDEKELEIKVRVGLLPSDAFPRARQAADPRERR
jgi:S1-C subfamily serine protease